MGELLVVPVFSFASYSLLDKPVHHLNMQQVTHGPGGGQPGQVAEFGGG